MFVAWSSSYNSIEAVIPTDWLTESQPKKGMLSVREAG